MVLKPATTQKSLSEEALMLELKAVSSMSLKMVEAAKAGEWDSVIEMEVLRDPALKTLSANLAEPHRDPSLHALWRQTIVSIIDLDKTVMRLAESQKAELVQEASDLESSRKAVNAYLDNVIP